MPLIAKLVVVGGEVKTAEIKLRLPSTIGRGRGATIMLPHPLVSRQHCELFETEGRLMVRDLGSLNGTFINNERISEAALPPGELLTVGAVTFRAVYEAAEANGPPAGDGPKLKTLSRDTDPNGTVRAPTKSSAPAPAASQSPSTEEEPSFDFEMPLTPVDEDARITDRPPEKKSAAAPPAPRPKTDEPTVPVPGSPAAKPAAGGPAKAPAADQAPAASAATPEAKGIEFSKWEHEEEEVKPEGEEDGDFGDFLKSLGPK
jgi:pSer/pThr/pTyr-binding forkhead associated (FHA) protein